MWDVGIGNLWSDLPGPLGASVYLDSEDTVPRGLEIVFPDGMGEDSDDRLIRGYQIDFIDDDAGSEKLFDPRELQAMVASYGGKLDEARSLDFAAVWWGTGIDLGSGYPRLELKNVGLGERDLRGAFARFSYEGRAAEDAVDKVEVLVWNRDVWESQVSQNSPLDAWWRDPELSLESIEVSEVAAEYAIGYPEGPAAPAAVSPYG